MTLFTRRFPAVRPDHGAFMISIPTVRKADIRLHYDLATPFYWLLWGRHLHHGYWEGNETVEIATQRLTDELVARARLRAGHEVLDIGCGMGGSSISLALGQQCRVTGMTLSSLQRFWATASARYRGAHDRVRFLRADAEEIEFPAASFDRCGASNARSIYLTSLDSFAAPHSGFAPGDGLYCAPGWPGNRR